MTEEQKQPETNNELSSEKENAQLHSKLSEELESDKAAHEQAGSPPIRKDRWIALYSRHLRSRKNNKTR